MSKLDLGLRIVQMLAELGIKPATFLGKASNVKKAFTGGKPTFFKPDVLETFRAQDGNFSDALKASLDQVNQTQRSAETLSKNFVLGDDSVSLSDVMIAGQKSNIAFQATVQVRNKLVSAYQDIMNMQV